jgi:hypothetical protein
LTTGYSQKENHKGDNALLLANHAPSMRLCNFGKEAEVQPVTLIKQMQNCDSPTASSQMASHDTDQMRTSCGSHRKRTHKW